MTATALLGMDTEQVGALGQRLVRDADEMDRLVAQVRRLVSTMGTSWQGADFTQFHAAWESTHSPALAAIAAGLRAHGQAALAQVAQQEQASAATGASGGAPGWAAGPLAGLAPVGASYAGATRPTDRDLALLAKGSYDDAGLPAGLSGSYHRLTADELRTIGIDPASLNTPRSGFAAAVYRSADGKYVLAYRGSEGEGLMGKLTNPDWHNNAIGAVAISEQTRQAAALAQQVGAGVGAGNLTVTGHSLGGRLASVASIVTGAPAVTWNAAGVSDAEFAYALHQAGRPDHLAGVIAKYGAISAAPLPMKFVLAHVDPFSAERAQLATGQIRSFNVAGEPLSTLQDNTWGADALGSRTTLPSAHGGFFSGERHGMEDVLDSYDRAQAGRR